MNQIWKPGSTSPQRGRQSLAQGEASAASQTLGSPSLKNRARFSGRKTFLSPAKTGSTNSREACPGLRFAWPGLNSAVRSADSLRHTSGKLSRLGLPILLVLFCAGAACTRQTGAIGSGSGGLPANSSTPAEISSSAQVVKANAAPVEIAANGSTDASIKLLIMRGYHVNANPATYPYLIATEITPGKVEGVSTEKPRYPAARTQKFEFADEPLAVYEGEAEVKLPLKVGGKTGQVSLPLSVRVQACDNEKCFPPATLNTGLQITVK